MSSRRLEPKGMADFAAKNLQKQRVCGKFVWKEEPFARRQSWPMNKNGRIEDYGDSEERELFEVLSLSAKEEAPKKEGGFWQGKRANQRLKSSALTRKPSSEAPARMESDLYNEMQEPEYVNDGFRHGGSQPIDIVKSKLRKRLQKQASWSSEASRDEAWERRKLLQEELQYMEEDGKCKAIGRCASDCGHRTWSGGDADSVRPRARTRSLTDDDLDELRGFIDLGFRFGTEDPELCNTLPALELCYAIARQFQDSPSGRSSPVSNHMDGGEESSPLGSPASSWKVSSPGDHPQQVKTRLRHWAQAVACTVRQCC